MKNSKTRQKIIEQLDIDILKDELIISDIALKEKYELLVEDLKENYYKSKLRKFQANVAVGMLISLVGIIMHFSGGYIGVKMPDKTALSNGLGFGGMIISLAGIAAGVILSNKEVFGKKITAKYDKRIEELKADILKIKNDTPIKEIEDDVKFWEY